MKQTLLSIMAVGIVAMLAGAGGLALFSDTEESSGNTFTAGRLDLRVDWTESYNGEVIEVQELTDNPGAIFLLEDVKPGDNGEATISLHVENNDAWIEMKIGNLLNMEEGRNEPEMEVDDTELEGELAQNLNVVIWEDDGNNILDEGEEVWFDGTPINFPERFVIGAIEGCENYYIGFKWWVDFEVGNEIQSDWISFDIIFAASQERHQPVSPFAEPENNILLVDSPLTGNPGDSDLYLVSLDDGAGQATLTYVDNLGENFLNVDALA